MNAYFSEPSLGYSMYTPGDVCLLKELDASLKANPISQVFVELNLFWFALLDLSLFQHQIIQSVYKIKRAHQIY